MLDKYNFPDDERRRAARFPTQARNGGASGELETSSDGQRASKVRTEEQVERRRETNRKSQANFRSRQQDALQRGAEAVEACKSACAQAKARRVELLVANRRLHERNGRASSTLLAIIRATTPLSPRQPATSSLKCRGDAAASDPAAHRNTPGPIQRQPTVAVHPIAAPPKPPRHVFVPLRIDMVAPPVSPQPSRSNARVPLAGPGPIPAGAPPSDGSMRLRDSCTHACWEPPDIRGSQQMAARQQEARRAAAEAAGAPPEAVVWVLQSPHAAPDAPPLSFTSGLASPQCMVSMYACFYISVLEDTLLAAVMSSTNPVTTNNGDATDGGHCDTALRPEAGSLRHDPAAMLAALDTALHGVHNLAAAGMLLRCGLNGRMPAALALPQIVAAVCRGARRCLPRPLWLQACASFVHFFSSLTKHRPLAASGCPHRKRGVDGGEVHDVITCPRCLVFGYILSVLRDEIVSALEGEAWRTEATLVAEVRARSVDLYGFCILMSTQCMADQPVSFRHSLNATRSKKIRNPVEEQQISLELFRRLRMSPEQQEAAAEAWWVWKRTRAALDAHLRVALAPFAMLPDLRDLVLERGAHSTHVAAHSVRSIRRSGWDLLPPPPATTGGRRGTLPPLHPPQPPAVTGGRRGTLPPLHPPQHVRKLDRDPAPEGGVCGASVCICRECADNMTVRLLGVSGRSMASAQRAVAGIVEVHRREGAAFLEQLRAICMPGVLFEPEQFARQMPLVLQHGVLTDWVAVCKIAAEELQHRELVEGMQHCCGMI